MKKVLTSLILIICIKGLNGQTKKDVGLMIRGGGFSQSEKRGFAPSFDITAQGSSAKGGLLGFGVGYIKTKEAPAIPIFMQIGLFPRDKKVNIAFSGNIGYPFMNKDYKVGSTLGNITGSFYANVMGGVQFRPEQKAGVTFQIGYTVLKYKLNVRNQRAASYTNGGFAFMIGLKLN